ncbi:MAG: family 78 glycoside hydrolase catalytic domain [bacterium]
MKQGTRIILAALAAGNSAWALAGETPNVARGKTCKVFSTLEADGCSAARLTDGESGGAGWSSKAFSAYADHRLYPEYVTVDLGRNYEIQRVVLYPGGAGATAGKGFPEDFTVQVCREGESWKTAVEKRGYQAPENGKAEAFDLAKAEGRFLKIEATRLREAEAGKCRFQLSELEVYGREKADGPLAVGKAAQKGAAAVTGLRCEQAVEPVGVDAEKPRMDWMLTSSARGDRQTAFRVLVASGREALDSGQGDLWDSGKVPGDQSVAVRYGGQPLKSGQRYHWKVMVWDGQGRPVPWSTPASFVTGKRKPEDWKGQWIGIPARSSLQARDNVLGMACEAVKADEVKWVQLDLGAPREIGRIILHPMLHNDPAAGGWIKGYAFPVRFRIDLSDDAAFKTAAAVTDQAKADYPNPGYAPVMFEAGGRKARYVRLTVTKLWQRGAGLPFAYTLGEMQVFSGGQNVALHAPVAANSSAEVSGWSKNQLTDGKALVQAAAAVEAKPADQLQHPHGAICLRKEIAVGKAVKRATAFFCGLGFSELAIDGVKVGSGVLTPGFTTYDKRVQYLVHDVTGPFAKPGRKTLGAVLADGWYGLEKEMWCHKFHEKPYVDQPKLKLDLRLEYADGSEETIVSDPTWKWSQGEITRSWLCEEDIDLRQAQPGWNRTGFDDKGWKRAVPVKGPEGRLVCQKETATRVTDVMKPQTLAAAKNGKAWLYDFGREFTGALRFRTSGPAGTQVKLTVCPPVGSQGCTPRVSAFTLAGKGVEEYAPRFCYNGISRLLVEGVAVAPSLDDLSAVELSGVAEVSGGFRCSNDLLNWLHESARKTHKAYVTFLPNDPIREYKAWMEDPQNMFCSAVHLYDSRAMYERWQHDMLDCQREDGNGANVAPGGVFDGCNSTWWGGCIVWIPWHWYLQFGDTSLLFESYDAMKRYVDYLGVAGQDHIQNWGLTDWCPVENTPAPIVNTPAYYLYANVVSQTAAMLGRKDDAERYAKLADTIRSKFNGKFLDPATGSIAQPGQTCTQAGQALSLALGLVPEAVRPRAEEALLKEIAAHTNHVSSGFVATPYLLQVLADLAPDIGYAMTTKQDYPSWYTMTAGSDHNLMQEMWTGRPALMPSLGGNIAGWHMQSLGGIRPDPAGPGFKKIIIKPNVVGDLHWVESWYDSVHGRIVSNWRRRGGALVMQLTIPANTTATVYVPARDAAAVKESGLPAEKAAGVTLLRSGTGAAVFRVTAGHYEFQSTVP